MYYSTLHSLYWSTTHPYIISAQRGHSQLINMVTSSGAASPTQLSVVVSSSTNQSRDWFLTQSYQETSKISFLNFQNLANNVSTLRRRLVSTFVCYSTTIIKLLCCTDSPVRMSPLHMMTDWTRLIQRVTQHYQDLRDKGEVSLSVACKVAIKLREWVIYYH